MSEKESKTATAVSELEEPRSGDVTVPIWLILVFGALFYSCQLYLSEHAGGFEKQVYAPFTSAEEVANANPKDESMRVYLMGQDVFAKTCAACHQASGLGKEGQFPPLVGSEWVLQPNPDRIAHAVLNGLSGPITVKGVAFNGAMPPWRDIYDDEHLAAVLSYIRDPRTWGNKAPAVKPSQVTAARKEVHPGPMSAAELLQIPVP